MSSDNADNIKKIVQYTIS